MALYETIRECSVLLKFAVGEAIAPLRIGTDQLNVLGVLEAVPGLRMNEIASRVLLDDSTTTRIVDSLEERGLAARGPDPEDRRARRVSITPDGRRLLHDAQIRSEQAVADRTAALGPRRAAALQRSLRELRSVLVTEGDDV